MKNIIKKLSAKASGFSETLLNKSFVKKIINYIKTASLPGFDKVPIYEVGVFFFKSITKSSIGIRAAATSYNILLSIFPGIVFFFTIIPYIPIPGFQDSLLHLMEDIIPSGIYSVVENVIFDIVTRPRGGLLSLGLVLMFLFATNGINSLIDAFNKSIYVEENRSQLKQRIISLMLFVVLFLLIIVAIVLLAIGPKFIKFILQNEVVNIQYKFYFYLIYVLKWIVILALCFFTISFLYYFAPAKSTRFRFISPGATLATIMAVIATLLFNYYLENFARYNVLYGSIGTLIIIMVWINFNISILLIGYELNMSIKSAGK